MRARGTHQFTRGSKTEELSFVRAEKPETMGHLFYVAGPRPGDARPSIVSLVKVTTSSGSLNGERQLSLPVQLWPEQL
jgi:hypothetical protein